MKLLTLCHDHVHYESRIRSRIRSLIKNLDKLSEKEIIEILNEINDQAISSGKLVDQYYKEYNESK